MGLLAQSADLANLYQVLEAKNGVDLDTLQEKRLYFLDGLFYNTEAEFETALNAIPMEDIRETVLWKDETNYFHHSGVFFAIIVVTKAATSDRATRRSALDSLQQLFETEVPPGVIRDFHCTCPVIIVDGERLNEFEARSRLLDMRLREVEYITTYDHPLDMVYGRYAQYGLVEIFTK